MAKNGRKTHCIRGHLLVGENLIPWKKRHDKRACRACNEEYQRNYYQNVTRRRVGSVGQMSFGILEGLS